MTNMGLEYLKYKENQRSNLSQEAETHRSNAAREKETHRSNLVNEAEVHRSNLAKEQETNRSNVARELETNRSNLAKEAETNRANKARELETNRSNRMDETLSAAKMLPVGAKEVWATAVTLYGGDVNKAAKAIQTKSKEVAKGASEVLEAMGVVDPNVKNSVSYAEQIMNRIATYIRDTGWKPSNYLIQ